MNRVEVFQKLEVLLNRVRFEGVSPEAIMTQVEKLQEQADAANLDIKLSLNLEDLQNLRGDSGFSNSDPVVDYDASGSPAPESSW